MESDRQADGWGLDDAGDRRSWGRDAQRSRGGGGRGLRGGGRGGGRFGGRGAGRDREGETREEMIERQREYQAAQAERKSWMEEHALEFPGAEYLHGVSPVLAALRYPYCRSLWRAKERERASERESARARARARAREREKKKETKR